MIIDTDLEWNSIKCFPLNRQLCLPAEKSLQQLFKARYKIFTKILFLQFGKMEQLKNSWQDYLRTISI